VRFVVFGTGAIGGVVGARLAQGGHEVALIARGAHGDKVAVDGLRLVDVHGDSVVRLPVAPAPAALDVGGDDASCWRSSPRTRWRRSMRYGARPPMPRSPASRMG